MRIGDLVTEGEGSGRYYGIVTKIDTNQVTVFLSNGLTILADESNLTTLYLKEGQTEGATANFAEIINSGA